MTWSERIGTGTCIWMTGGNIVYGLEAKLGEFSEIEEWAMEYLDIFPPVFPEQFDASRYEKIGDGLYQALEEASSEEAKRLFASVSNPYYTFTKHVRDPESADILDIIRGSRVFDFGYYNMTIGLDSIPVNLYQTYGNADNLVSFYQKKEKVANKALEKLMKSYESIAEAQQELLP